MNVRMFLGKAKKVAAATVMTALVLTNLNSVDSKAASTDLIDNGGFEEGMGTWVFFDNCTIEVTSDEKFSGNNSMHVTKRGTTGSGPSQIITGEIQEGITYKVSAKVKYMDGPNTRDFVISVRNGLDWTGITNMSSATITKGEWGTIEGEYTLPEGADLQQSLVFVETSWTAEQDPANDLMDFYVDDVSVIDSSAVTEDTATEVTVTADTTSDDATEVVATEVPKTGEESQNILFATFAVGFAFSTVFLHVRRKKERVI